MLVLMIVLGLAYGTAVHVVQLVSSGFDPYPGLPGWLRTYFVALTVLDPVAAVLLARRHRSGVALATTVFVSDTVGNGLANYVFDPSRGVTAGRLGHGVITILALAMCAATPWLWRHASVVPRWQHIVVTGLLPQSVQERRRRERDTATSGWEDRVHEHGGEH